MTNRPVRSVSDVPGLTDALRQPTFDAMRVGLTVDKCNDAAPWVLESAGVGSVTLKAGDIVSPSGTLLFSTTANASFYTYRHISASIPKGGAIVIRMKRDANLSAIDPQFYTGPYAAQALWTLNLGVSTIPVGVWYDLVLPLSFFAANYIPGSRTITAMERITGLRFRVTPATSTNTVLEIASIKFVAPDNIPRIVFQFDDGRLDNYTNAYPILKANGYAGSIAVEYTAVGGTSRCTLAQLQEMYADGWEILGHHTQPITELTESAAVGVFQSCLNWMATSGFVRGRSHWCWPGGFRNTTVDAWAARYFKTRRAVVAMSKVAARGVYDPYDPSVLYLPNTVTVATVKTYIDRVRDFGGTLICVFHGVATPTADVYDYSVANFTEIVQYAAAQGLVGTNFDETFGVSSPESGVR